MFNFTYHNPVKIVFGKGTISELPNLIEKNKKIMITSGLGSIKRNGVYDQVKNALSGYNLVEFEGIQPNPEYDTLMKAVEIGKNDEVDFLLSVGGGSVLDGTKFIAAGICFEGNDPWEILSDGAEVKKAVPIGAILTLSATGSEMNGFSVISRSSTLDKLPFSSPFVYPVFSILDPQTTFSLPERQIINGIVDPFVHVTEQYLTYNANAPLQDRQAEAVLSALIETAPKCLECPTDYDARATLMWCATQALNGIIGCGVPQDWATHYIGHELTALFGLDHAQALAVVLPGVLKHQKKNKAEKLVQYAKRVWGVNSGADEDKIDAAINKTIEFFKSIGMPVSLGEYNISSDNFRAIAEKIASRGVMLGEHQNIGKKEIVSILSLCV